MSPHVDILEQPERLAPSFFGSLAFHGLLVAAIVGIGWVQSRNTIIAGRPQRRTHGGGDGEPGFHDLAAFACRRQESGGHRHESARARSDCQSQARAESEGARSEARSRFPAAAPKTRPSEAAAPPDKWRASQKDLPNQLYSTAGTRVTTQDYALAGGGGVGVGNNSPFGNQFGAYADLLRKRVAQYWQTTDHRSAAAHGAAGERDVHAPPGRQRDAASTSPKGAASAPWTISAQRAIMDAAPFPPLPPQFPKNEAEIEFVFELKR